MTEPNSVLDSIRHSIQKNGYPEKAVRLPFRPVYDSCKKNGLPLAQALATLKEEGIVGVITGDHILFQTRDMAEAALASRATSIPDIPKFGGSMEEANEKFRGLAEDMIAHMSPEERQQMEKQLAGMSEEDKQALFAQYRQMFDDPSAQSEKE